MLYSYRIYRVHKAQGIVYSASRKSKSQKTVSIAAVIVILAAVAVLMFTGEIVCTCGEESLQIEATYASNLDVPYADIDTIELREDFDIGLRIMGFNSARLALGTFQNEELQDYTLYAYPACDSMILIHSGEKVLALNAQTAEKTKELYEILLEKFGK